MTKSIYVKDYDRTCFGIRMYQEHPSKKGEEIIATEVFINDDNSLECTNERMALTDALQKLIENHEDELMKLYEEKLKENEDD